MENEKIINENNIYNFILNETNKLIDEDFINNIFSKYGINHKIKDKKLFQLAFINSSYTKSKIEEKKEILINSLNRKEILEECKSINVLQFFDECYDRLEFLGDSIIHAILTEYLYKRYETENEGFMTKLRIKLEGGHMMSIITRKLELNKYIIFAKYIETEYGRDRNVHILEDVLEAFICALFIDTNYNYDICKKFLINLIEEEINFAQILNTENNYKDLLLQYFHKMKWTNPEYCMLEQVLSQNDHKETQNDNKRFFKMAVKKQSKIIGVGYGISKKIGEQMSAKDALIRLGEITQEDTNKEIFKESDNID